ncbi:helix-turn-helix transcriptional regulator [Streptomyces sp. VRA16 Mangrove soil]|uniref:helix-turn-helix domain-containing protein n=1 Tax=Streptomyces sp. VRA16 Mangrove soil TaxID=2817434 RepID=UPI001A9F28BA|nr:helix-turn-helix transcriptional regulator [Streptomyces sp. VRA16 Mangrove soil]MBO1331279.1 helix-turn-helix transcriptional regulator [Streptomyces sp. VRA16 Mangrove soil]
MSQEVRLAGRLIDARISAGLSQRQASGLLEISPTVLSRIENASRFPALAEVGAMARLYAKGIHEAEKMSRELTDIWRSAMDSRVRVEPAKVVVPRAERPAPQVVLKTGERSAPQVVLKTGERSAPQVVLKAGDSPASQVVMKSGEVMPLNVALRPEPAPQISSVGDFIHGTSIGRVSNEATTAFKELRQAHKFETNEAPQPTGISTPAELVEALNEVHVWAGSPSLRKMEMAEVRRASSTSLPSGSLYLNKSSVSEMLRRPKLPTLPRMLAFLTACGIRDRARDEWKFTWQRLKMQERRAGGLSA